MIRQILNDKVSVYAQPDMKSPLLAKLAGGDEIVTCERCQSWFEVTRKDGLHGYIRGSVQFREYEPQAILEEEFDVFDRPNPKARVIAHFLKGQPLYIFDTVLGEEGKEKWIRVRIPEGRDGFIRGKTQIATEPVRPEGMGVMKTAENIVKIFKLFK